MARGEALLSCERSTKSLSSCLLRFLVRVSLRLSMAVGVLGRSISSDPRLPDLEAKGSMLRKAGFLELVLPIVMVLDREKLKKVDEAVDATDDLL
jgi:hypothetical protein